MDERCVSAEREKMRWSPRLLCTLWSAAMYMWEYVPADVSWKWGSRR